jgi:hypothetical protein
VGLREHDNEMYGFYKAESSLTNCGTIKFLRIMLRGVGFLHISKTYKMFKRINSIKGKPRRPT